jgi:maltose alpha-D-glucosyltransferase/alpha-amylase
MPSRVGSAEQSNTSILYGKEFILKLFRRLQPGENPDVEIGRFLTDIAHFPSIAPYLGEIAITPVGGEKTTVAMVQGFVANQGDGWDWVLKQLDSFFGEMSANSAPAIPPSPNFFDGLSAEPLMKHLEPARASLQAAALLGRRTAEMHLALSTPSDWQPFSPEPLSAEDLNQEAIRIESQVKSAMDALKSRLLTLDDLTSDDAGLLLSRRVSLVARARALVNMSASGQRIRIHGDFHLGQTLRTSEVAKDPAKFPPGESGDFVLLDFEGEPARSLAERRRMHSPLKDVAGMMRSFSYAAFAGAERFSSAQKEGSIPSPPGAILAWARLWENAACTAFLRSYRIAIAANPALLPAPELSQALLDAYMLEKALYELLYELNNRPAWLSVPIAGILSL